MQTAKFVLLAGLERLETRALLSAAPVFADFSARLPIVFQGDPVTLSADVSDPDVTVQQVEFYRDVDGNGQLNIGTDELLGSDIDGGDGWSLTVPAASYPIGTVHWLAEATDDASDTSLATTSTEVIDQLDLGSYNIALMGDSITQSISSQQSYRYPFWQKLIDAAYPFDLVGSLDSNFNGNPTWPPYQGQSFDRDHEGHAGLRADEFLTTTPTSLADWLNGYAPDVVLLHLGTNDIRQYAGPETVEQMVEETLGDLEDIIGVLRSEYPHVVIVVAQILPSRNSAINDRINLFNAALPEKVGLWTTLQSPVVLVDQNSGFDPAIGADSYDGIHPNASGEEKMAQRWFERFVDITVTHPRITSLSGDIAGAIGQTLDYTAAATDADSSETLTYTWDFGDASPPQAGIDLTGVNHAFGQTGDFTITLTVADDDGGSSTSYLEVNIGPPSLTVYQTQVTVGEGQPAANAGTVARLGNGSLSATIGNVVDNGNGTWSWSFASADGPDESQQVTITATDGDGDMTSVMFDLTVNNLVPGIGVEATTVTVSAGELASMSGTHSDVGLDTVTLSASLGTVTDGGDGTWSWLLDTTGQPNGSQSVTITATDSDGGNGSIPFTLTISDAGPSIQQSLFLSSDFNSTVGGVGFADEDVLEYDLETQTWSLFFDGSAAGIAGSSDVDAVEVLVDGSLLFSLSGTDTLAGIGTVADEDIVRFIPASGAFEMFFDGSDVGLDVAGAGGGIDAVTFAPDGRLVVSFDTGFSLEALSGDNEDLVVFNQTSLGAYTSGTWELYADGTDVQIGSHPDFNGAWIDGPTGRLFLTSFSPFTVTNVSGENSDIISGVPSLLGDTTLVPFSKFLEGATVGMGGQRLDAVAIERPAGTLVNLPADISLLDTVSALHETTDTTNRVAVADIMVVDDGFGSNQLALAGDHAASFEIDSGTLYLSAGTTLDASTDPVLQVIVEVDDATISGAADDSVMLSITIMDGVADLEVTVDDGVTTALAGDTLTYTIVASNHGPDAAMGATVSDVFTPELTNLQLVSITPSGGAASSLTAGGLDGALNDTVDLPAGSSITYQVTALIVGSATGTLTNTVSVTPPEPVVVDLISGNDLASDNDTLIVPPPPGEADLEISKSADPMRPAVGGMVSFSLAVINHGPDEATAVVVEDVLPSGLSFVSSDATQGAYDHVSGTWNLGHLSIGATATLQITARVMPGANDPAGSGAYIDDFVSVSSGGLESPNFMLFSPDGYLIVASEDTDEVLRYDAATGDFVDVFIPAGSGGLLSPNGLTYGPDGRLYVSSQGTDEVLRFDAATGAFIDVFAVPHTDPANGGLDTPGVLTFGPDGNLYVSSIGSNPDDVFRYDGTTGAFIDRFVAEASGGMHGPWGMAFGPDGNLYVSSFHTDEVLRYNGTSGAFMDVFASGGGLLGPRGLTFGPDGNLYVSSRFVNSVFRYDGATGAFLDTFATHPNLSGGQGVLFGPDGNLYVASHFLNRVQRFDGFITNYAAVSTSATDPDATNDSDFAGIDYSVGGPRITSVRVGSTSWAQTYRDLVDSEAGESGTGIGFLIPDGPGQADALFWGNIRQIVLEFDKDVTGSGPANVLVPGDFSLTGIHQPSYLISSVDYDQTAFRATLNIAANLPMDRYQLTVDASKVHDLAGNALDGEWEQNVQIGDSGDGVVGGDFVYDFNVAPGSFNQDKTPDSSDLSILGASWMETHLDPFYRWNADANGDLQNDSSDLSILGANWMQSLPDPPMAPLAAAAIAAAPPNDVMAAAVVDQIFAADDKETDHARKIGAIGVNLPHEPTPPYNKFDVCRFGRAARASIVFRQRPDFSGRYCLLREKHSSPAGFPLLLLSFLRGGEE